MNTQEIARPISRGPYPYKGARIVRRVTGILPAPGPHAGATFTLTVFEDMASKGYKSGYEAVPQRWYEIRRAAIGNSPRARWCWGFSGRRFDSPLALLEDALKQLLADGATITEDTLPAVRAPQRYDYCTHPDQEWCDCDWCRTLRTSPAVGA